jgi:hypothetical protein
VTTAAPGTTTTTTKAIPSSGQDRVRVGQCFNNEWDADKVSIHLDVVPCDVPHQNEAVAQLDMSALMSNATTGSAEFLDVLSRHVNRRYRSTPGSHRRRFRTRSGDRHALSATSTSFGRTTCAGSGRGRDVYALLLAGELDGGPGRDCRVPPRAGPVRRV